MSPLLSNLRSSARERTFLATVAGEGGGGLRSHCTDEKAEAQGGRAVICSKGPWEVGRGQGCKPPAPHVLSAPLRRMKDEFIIDGRNTWEPVRMWISLLS